MCPSQFHTYHARGIANGNSKLSTGDRHASGAFIDGQGYGYTAQEYGFTSSASPSSSHTPSSQESDYYPQTFFPNQSTSQDLQNDHYSYHDGAEAIGQVTGQNSSPAYYPYAATQNGQPPGYSPRSPGLASFPTQRGTRGTRETQGWEHNAYGPQYLPLPTATPTRESRDDDNSWSTLSTNAALRPEHASRSSEMVDARETPSRELHEPRYGENSAATTSTLVRDKVASPGVLAASRARRTGKDASYRCHRCGSTFTSSHNLQSHIRAHLGLRPYPCVGCQRGFGTKSDMKRHEKTCKSRQPDFQ